MALLLLRHGSDPNTCARTEDGELLSPLYYAARRGNAALCEALVAGGARVGLGRSPLGIEGLTEEVREVLTGGEVVGGLCFPRLCFADINV